MRPALPENLRAKIQARRAGAATGFGKDPVAPLICGGSLLRPVMLIVEHRHGQPLPGISKPPVAPCVVMEIAIDPMFGLQSRRGSR